MEKIYNIPTISQLSPSGASCSANSGVGLSFRTSKTGNSHLPGVCPGAATITNYFLPVSSPWDALGDHYPIYVTFSETKDKNFFTKDACFTFVTLQKTGQINNREGPPVEYKQNPKNTENKLLKNKINIETNLIINTDALNSSLLGDTEDSI